MGGAPAGAERAVLTPPSRPPHPANREHHHGEEENDPDDSAGAHADARAGPDGARAQLQGSRHRLHAGGWRCARPSAACSAPTSRACAAARSASTSRPSSRRSPRSTTTAPTTSSPTPTCCPSVCGRVCPQENQCEGVCTVGDTLEPVAIGRLERFVGDMAIREGWVNVPYIEPIGLQGRHRRLGPGGHGLRRRHGEGRLRSHRLRGVPRARRRAEVRHSRFPPAQRGDRRRDRQAEAARRQVRVQHAGRAAVHDRADDHRDGLPRRVHRHRRRLPELHGHSRRVAERRAVGQRAAHALQPDARARLSRTSTRRCSPASASR